MPSRTKDRSILPLALGELAPVEIQASSLETLMPAIEKLRDDLTNQAFVVRLDLSQRLTVLPPHLPLYKMAVWTLNNAAQLALHQQRLNLAAENLVAIAALVDLSGSEGRLISERVCMPSPQPV